MLRTKSKRRTRKGDGNEMADLRLCALRLALPVLAILFLYGCSPPEDYYHKIMKMEEQGEQARQKTGRRPGEVVAPEANTKSIKVARASEQQITPDEPQKQTEDIPVMKQEEEIQERPPQREIIRETPPPESTQKPVAVKSDVIKNALNAASLGISVRTVESVNGRLSGGKNSVRVYFTPGSMDVIDDKFGAICAVLYYLNSETDTIDVVAGIAEDDQSDLLAILQSSIGNIKAWMTNEITKTEWYSRITKKIL